MQFLLAVFLLACACAFASSDELARSGGAVEDHGLSLGRRLQATYNMFKSYKNVPASQRPPSYSATQNTHDISEYLTSQQQMMKAQRNGPVSSGNAMTGSWSGFNEYKTMGLPLSTPSLRGSLKIAPLSSRADGISR